MQKVLKYLEKPNISADKQFKKQLDKKLSKKIQEKEEVYQQQIINAVPNFAKWRFRLNGFVTAMCAFLFVFILSFFSDFFTDQISVPSKYQYLENEAFIYSELATNLTEESVVAGVSEQVVSPRFTYGVLSAMDEGIEEQHYRFLYDGKKYPKISAELPVYKRSSALVNKSVLAENISRLKFGGISLKDFPDLGFSYLSLESDENSGFSVSINLKNGTLSMYDTSVVDEEEIPLTISATAEQQNPVMSDFSEKELKKNIERKLKDFGISLD